MFKFFQILLLLLVYSGLLFADTFINKSSGEKFIGYATTKKNQNLTLVRTGQGTKMLDLADFQIISDSNGRENLITVIELKDAIQYKAQTNVFIDSVEKAANRGGLFVLLEIDSPGGRLDLCRDICLKIEDINNCQIIAYVKSGANGGAYSAAAAVALACDKIYMDAGTAIGAATPYMMTQAGIKESDEEVLKGFAGVFAMYAEKNNRPPMLAAAMVDNQLAVAEILHEGKRYFVDPNENRQFEPTKIWSSKGQLLSLSADDAFDTGISDGTVSGFDELLTLLKANQAQIKYDKAPIRIKDEIEKAKAKIQRTLSWADLRIRKLNTEKVNYQEAMHIITNLRKDLNDSLGMLQKYPDIEVDRKSLEHLLEQCNQILAR